MILNMHANTEAIDGGASVYKLKLQAPYFQNHPCSLSNDWQETILVIFFLWSAYLQVLRATYSYYQVLHEVYNE